ncbi:hypothetical protein GCM10027592_58340 [Spirosoma flavus]
MSDVGEEITLQGVHLLEGFGFERPASQFLSKHTSAVLASNYIETRTAQTQNYKA